MELTTYTRGLIAEIYAMLYLMCKGYRIVSWRYKTPVGEVDIIARRGKTLAFVEVKLRKSLDDGLYAITPKMKSRITRAASHFMARNMSGQGAGGYTLQPRFDVVVVAGLRLRHLDNAWLSAA